MTTPVMTGRTRIYTDKTVEELESDDVVKEELKRTLGIHRGNAQQIAYRQ